ncbi:MAG: hypothetical protein CDV28_12419 [Candidatus Electronema aureum]|uniref:Uncharacterized protein n=1 Tax=Candidatus Electronema aureum TaxID=2005002 RepID=A0A521G0I8_9BACT|nr:MAG: hypothetical protein CDV28_12419 [Candidatus Electronema aureum]
MEIIAYGEDALTLWALKEKLPEILELLDDDSNPADCQIFYRPSFGRGGRSKKMFGEFDFILLATKTLYLGESKWKGSNEKIKNNILQLQPNQEQRHRVFKCYVNEWAFGNYLSWHKFKGEKQEFFGVEIPNDNDGIARNLQTLLGIIKKHFTSEPVVNNVLLFLHDDTGKIPQKASSDFIVVPIDYSEASFDNFIRLKL